MGLLHLSQSYVTDRFPPDSQEEFMPAPRKKVRKPRTTDPRPGQGRPKAKKAAPSRKPQAKRAAPSSRKTSPLRAGRKAASGSSPKLGEKTADMIARYKGKSKPRAMGKQKPIGTKRPSSRAAGKLSSTVDRAFKRITASKLAPSREGRILVKSAKKTRRRR